MRDEPGGLEQDGGCNAVVKAESDSESPFSGEKFREREAEQR